MNGGNLFLSQAKTTIRLVSFTAFCSGDVLVLNVEKRKSIFLLNASGFPKEHCFLEDVQASSVCPSGKSSLYMN
jgi:hypothetical protein